jgi:MFS family permease
VDPTTSTSAPNTALRAPALRALGFVVGFGVVSLLGDATYEGARSVLGPFLGHLGASAAVVGLVTGASEAVAYVPRVLTGVLADRRARRWPFAAAGYALTVVPVPLLAVASRLAAAIPLVFAERMGKAVRTPARDAMLADAGTVVGQGRAFGLHEAMDQTGALVGPLGVAAALALGLGYRGAFALLALPALGVLAALGILWRRVPDPHAYALVGPGAPPAETPMAPPPSEGSVARARTRRRGNEGPRPSGAAPPARKRARAAAGSAVRDRFGGSYWAYLAFSVLAMAGYPTFGVLSYQLHAHRIVALDQVPLAYALAMGAAAGAALAAGRLWSRVGLAGLVGLPPATVAVALLAFAGRVALAWIGIFAWGVAMGLQESTMRAAVATMAPPTRRGLAYGVFGAAYGMAWMAGGAATGALVARGHADVDAYVAAVELAALLLLIGVLAVRRHRGVATRG